MDADEHELAGAFRKLYVEALEDRNINPRCTVCGENAWEPLCDANIRLQGTDSDGTIHSGRGPLVTGATCGNCGTVRLIDQRHLPF